MRTSAAILLLCGTLVGQSLLAEQPPTYRGRTIAQWSDDLSHPNMVVRVEAGKMLGRLGSHAHAAVDSLIAALRDRNPDVRLHAAAALGTIKHQPVKCLTELTKLLEDRDNHVRFAAEWSLARIALEVQTSKPAADDAKQLAVLLAAAEKALAKSARNFKHLQQVSQARSALESPNGTDVKPIAETRPRRVQPRSQPDPEKNTDLIAALQSDDKITQLKAIDAIVGLGRIADLVEAWRRTDDEFLRWQLSRAFVRIREPAVPALARTLQGQDPEAAVMATNCLVQMRSSAIGALPQLLAVIEDQAASNDVRESAIWVIESLGPSAQDAVATLTAILNRDDEPELAETCLRALGSIGPAAQGAEPILLKILRSESRPPAVRMAAAEALPSISPMSDEAVAALVDLLAQQNEPIFVASLANALGEYGSPSQAAVPRLIELVDSSSEEVRTLVIRALGQIGPASKAATSRLIECLTAGDDSEMIHVAAARSLGQLGPDAVIALADQLEHPDRQVRSTIIRAFIEMGDQAEPAVKPLELRVLDRDELPNLQALATVALGQIGPSAKSVIPTLNRVMGDVRQAVYLRAMAAISIGQIDPGQSPTLIAAMHDTDPQIRVAAAYTLQRLPSPHPDALPTLIRELENEASRSMAMQALGEFKDASRQPLTDLVNDPTHGEQTRIAGLIVIGEGGMDSTELLLEALNDAALIESAYLLLRDLGNDSIPYLISAADDETKFNDEARGVVRELVEELYGGIGGGGEGEGEWTAGHALVDWSHRSIHPAARMATAAPMMLERAEEPRAAEAAPAPRAEEMSLPEPNAAMTAGRSQDAAPARTLLTTPPVMPENGFKTVKVFYGTNREATQSGTGLNGFRLPWFVQLILAVALLGLIVFVIRQIRHRQTGPAVVGVAGFILLFLAVEAAVTRIQQLDESIANPGPTYGTEYSPNVKLGFCDVTIPDIHREGEIERPSIIRLQVVEDPEKHIVLKRVTQLDNDAFFAELKGELGQRGNSILVFVHGYNASFESAARRTAQMSHDLKFAGAPMFYSWPSQANWLKYRVDEKNVELSITQLKTFLVEITRRSGADTINLIAHSMGNRALTNALKEIELVSSEKKTLFNQVILAAPDIDADIFRERIAPAIIPKARKITLYASSNDLALVASREFNNGDARAGDAGANLVLVPGIDTIDVSAGSVSLLGHTYYGDSTSVLRDIEFLLRDRPADQRDGLQPFPRLEPTYWLFQPGVVARRDDGNNVVR